MKKGNKKIMTLAEICKVDSTKGKYIRIYLDKHWEKISGPIKPVLDVDTGVIYPTLGLGYHHEQLEYDCIRRAVKKSITMESFFFPFRNKTLDSYICRDSHGENVALHYFVSCGDIPLSVLKKIISIYI